MAVGKSASPEEAILALSRLVREEKLTRPELLREIMKVGLSEQKRWKAIRGVELGKVGMRQGAEMAGLDEAAFRELVETRRHA
ncbi:MAG: hypothetical protein ACE5LS_02365 [Thermoplasmata archaeon]